MCVCADRRPKTDRILLLFCYLSESQLRACTRARSVFVSPRKIIKKKKAYNVYNSSIDGIKSPRRVRTQRHVSLVRNFYGLFPGRGWSALNALLSTEYSPITIRVDTRNSGDRSKVHRSSVRRKRQLLWRFFKAKTHAWNVDKKYTGKFV